MTISELKPGRRVRVAHNIERRDENWQCEIEGVVRCISPRPTGSWHARGPGGKLWLARLCLEKDGGELTTLNIDSRTRIEVFD